MSKFVDILGFPVKISQFLGKKDYPNNNSLKKSMKNSKLVKILVI